MTEDDVLKVLAKKHHRDAFFTHVGVGGRIIDAIVFNWQGDPGLSVIGYEVKTSRSDFLNDSKWGSYLEYCNRFYFATPAKLVKRSDVPGEHVGLIWIYPSGYTRVIKAVPRREVDIPRDMLKGIICTRIATDRPPFYSSTRKYLEAWVKDKGNRRALGFAVETKMAQRLSELEREVAEAKRKLEYRDVVHQAVEEVLKEAGIDIRTWGWKNRLIDRLQGKMYRGAMNRLRQFRDYLTGLVGEEDD